MILKYGKNCSSCGVYVPAGKEADYDPATKEVKHRTCDAPAGDGHPDPAGLARALGYIASGEPIPDWWITGQRPEMLLLSDGLGTHQRKADRTDDGARRDIGSLFDVPREDEA